ncbi:MAG: protein kinase, partial [Candidatus Hydrogenedentes bacterium]|nr:protein kinase [Candidatus Hydrogenedentota bacterium]
AEILPWVEQVSQALDHAHSQGVLHRDVKPANILMTKEDEVLLADFGIARTAREASSRATGQVTSGTLLFMSPEQLMGEPLDQRSDLYSMASCVYELLSGSPPFYKGAIVSQIRSKEPASIPYCGEAVNRVLLKALNKEPSNRHDTCGQFFDALAQVAGYAKPSAAPPGFGAARFNMHADLVDPNADTIPLPPEHAEGMTKPLGALLVEAGLITEDQLLEALISHNATRERLGAMLIRLGFVSPQTIAETLQHQLHVQPAALSVATFDPSLLRLVPPDVARRFRCIPLRREGGRVLVAMADPLDFQALNDLEERLGGPVEPCIATEDEIQSAIGTAYRRHPGEH